MTINQMNMLQVGMPPISSNPAVKVNKRSKSVRIGLHTKADSPTRKIKRLASFAPGGVVRWSEAARLYVDSSQSAREDERAGDTHYHLNLQQIFRRYFLKVEGVRGYYVLKTMADGHNEEP